MEERCRETHRRTNLEETEQDLQHLFEEIIRKKKSKKTSTLQKFIEDKGKNLKIQTNTKFALRTTWGSCGVIFQLNVVIA